MPFCENARFEKNQILIPLVSQFVCANRALFYHYLFCFAHTFMFRFTRNKHHCGFVQSSTFSKCSFSAYESKMKRVPAQRDKQCSIHARLVLKCSICAKRIKKMSSTLKRIMKKARLEEKVYTRVYVVCFLCVPVSLCVSRAWKSICGCVCVCVCE